MVHKLWTKIYGPNIFVGKDLRQPTVDSRESTMLAAMTSNLAVLRASIMSTEVDTLKLAQYLIGPYRPIAFD